MTYDPAFFGITAHEAIVMHPQRVATRAAWQALNREAGLGPDRPAPGHKTARMGTQRRRPVRRYLVLRRRPTASSYGAGGANSHATIPMPVEIS